MNPNIFSDLRKPGLVPGKSLSLSTKIDSVLEKYLSYIMTNKMRSIHMKKIVQIVLFISDVQNYIPIKLCKTSASLHLFKIKGTLRPEDIKLNRNYLWDTLEINWNGIKLSFNGNEIDLPKIITIKM